MAHRALTFGFGGYAELDVTFGEFFQTNHTVMVRYMPQCPYAGVGPMLAEASGNGTYVIGQGEYRDGSGDFKVLGPSTLTVKMGAVSVVYEVPDFENKVGGPVGYRSVWQHLAVVRTANTFRTYFNGKQLTPFSGVETIPATGLPSNATRLRIGRRSPETTGTLDLSRRFWQFYGFIDDVAIYTRVLSASEIAHAATSPLTGAESDLLAGWTFDTGVTSPPLSRAVTLPTATDVQAYVTHQAAHPVPVYYVVVSADRNSSEDSEKMDLRPSKVDTTLPFAAGQWWRVSQGHEHPAGSHNGGTAAFAWDLVRTNGHTVGTVVLGAAPGRVIYLSASEVEEAISAYHTVHERVVYMHLTAGSFAQHFPNLGADPQNLPSTSQPKYDSRDPLASVGEESKHLHFTISAIEGETISGGGDPNAGPGMPVELVDYYTSNDEGQTWKKVPHGIPVAGDWISQYPWSPWGAKGDSLDVAPAVASRGSNRLDVFVRGEDNHLWILQWDGQRWSKWRDMGAGRLTSSPAAVSWGPGRLDVFVRGHDGQLAHKRWAEDKGWSEWRDLGGRLTSAPAAVSWGLNRLDVFVRGHDGQLAHKRWTNDKDWSEWRDLGGRLTSGPAVASWDQNRLDVFVRGHDGQLAHKRWTNDKDWSEWRDLGGRLTSGPATVSWGLNRIDVFVRGFQHGLAQMVWTPETQWSSWKNLDVDF